VLKEFKKMPLAVLRYGFDLKNWLSPGDVVVAATAELLDANTAVELAEPEPRIAADGASVTVQLQGGEIDDRVRVRVTWTTASGDIDARSFLITVQDR
jgi:hypothetical protein